MRFGIVAPSRFDHGDEIKNRPATQGIVDEVGMRAKSQADIRSHPARIDVRRVHGCAERHTTGKSWLICLSKPEMLAHARTHTVGTDQEIGEVLNFPRASLHAHGDLIAVGPDVRYG